MTLPFVVGVLADLGGQAEKPPLSSRQFMDVTRDNLPPHPGLTYLFNNANGENVKIRVLDVSHKELHRDLTRSVAFDQSILFKKVHDDIFGTHNAEPFAILIGDYEFCNDSADANFLERLSQVAEAIHAPFLAGAVRQLLFLDDVGTPEDVRWRSFRKSESARYVCLTTPRMLLSPPPSIVWGNSAFALGVRIVAAFVRFGWCANIRGRDGGMVTGLPKQWLGQYLTSAEVVLELWQEKALSEAGLICFGHDRGPSDGFAFVRTCHQPIIYESAEATETARLAADLRYVLAISRFVHYLRVMIRDQQSDVGALNQWIAQYVCHEKEPSPEKPLGSAHVDVSQRTVTLRASPRFQLEPLIYPLRATFPLPA